MRFNILTITIGITVSITFLFVIGIPQSQADIQIWAMYPTYGASSYNNYGSYYEYTGEFYDVVYVKTSEPYYTIDYYIDGKYVGYSSGDNVKTEAYFYMGGNPGSPHGKVYTIKAVAWSLYDENIGNHHSDTSSFDVEVTSERIRDFYHGGGFTNSYMEVYVDVGWNGRTAEVVIGGVVKNYSAEENIIYGLNGQYQVGRTTAEIGQEPDIVTSGVLRKSGGISKRRISRGIDEGKGNITYSERGAVTDSVTIPRANLQLENSIYFVEAQMTATARYANDHPDDQDEIVVDEYQELRSDDFPDN